MKREKITFEDGQWRVPNYPIIPYIEGDGIGEEITEAMRHVVNHAVERCYHGARAIAWHELFAGEKSVRQGGSPLPEETLEALRAYRIAIKGPLNTPVGEGARSLNVAMRQLLDLYICLRPVRWFQGVASPIKEPQNVDMTIFRENSEDLYSGIEWMAGTAEVKRVIHFLQEEMGVVNIRFPQSSSIGIKPVSREGSERLMVAAIDYALKHHLPSVTIVHKGNIMKFTEGGFNRWSYALAEEKYGDRLFTMRQYRELLKQQGAASAEAALKEAKEAQRLIIKDVIADAFLQNSLLRPEDYSVIATLNLNGDYISDLLAAMVGGIGIAPGANINDQTGYALFEATHGTAPDIAGKNCANPSSIILSAVMLLEQLGWHEVGTLITESMETLFRQGIATGDLARFMPNGNAVSTTDFISFLINQMNFNHE